MTTLPTNRSTSNTVAEHISDHNEIHSGHNLDETHRAATTSVHGIANTANLITGITVQDENANVATGVTQIDFQGAGVTATAGTGEVIVTIPASGGATNLDGLTDVVITSPSLGQVVKYNGSSWVNDTDATGGAGGGAVNTLDSIRFVSKSGNDTTGDGLSWGTAYLTIQKGISALTAGGTVFVGGGTYTDPFGVDQDVVRVVGVAWGGGTIIERQTNRTMINIRGLSDVSAANHVRYISLENLQFKDNGVGNNPSNPFIKMHYISNCAIKDCRANQIKGTVFSFVEAYDSVFNHFYGVDVGGSDGTKPAVYAQDALDTTTAGLGTITSSGTAVTGTGTYFKSWVQVGDTITAGGQTKTVSAVNSDTSLTTTAFSPVVTGASWTVRHNDNAADNSNNLNFTQLHLESVQDGAIWLVGGGASDLNNKCKFTQVKIENRKVTGTPALKLRFCSQIHFDDVQITYGQFAAGFNTPADMIELSSCDGIYFGDVYLEANSSNDCTATMIHLAGGAKRVNFNAVRWVTAGSNLPDFVWKFSTLVGTGTNSFHPGLMEQVSGTAAYAPGGANFQNGNPDSDLTRYFQDRVQALGNVSGAITPEIYAGEDVKITLIGNVTINKPTKARSSDRVVYIFTQDATGGRTVTWGSGFSATSGWSVNTAANGVSSVQFLYDGTNWIRFPT